MVEREPLRERRWELLMLALYRDGRQAEALHAFARAQRLLDRELGAHPGPGLAALERAILRQDAKLDPELPDYAYDAVAQRRRAMAALEVADAHAHALPPETAGRGAARWRRPRAHARRCSSRRPRRATPISPKRRPRPRSPDANGGMGSVGEGVDSARVAALEAALVATRRRRPRPAPAC